MSEEHKQYLNRSLTRLKNKAVQYCIFIFQVYDELEIKEQPPSIRSAWETGQEISALMDEMQADEVNSND